MSLCSNIPERLFMLLVYIKNIIIFYWSSDCVVAVVAVISLPGDWGGGASLVMAHGVRKMGRCGPKFFWIFWTGPNIKDLWCEPNVSCGHSGQDQTSISLINPGIPFSILFGTLKWLLKSMIFDEWHPVIFRNSSLKVMKIIFNWLYLHISKQVVPPMYLKVFLVPWKEMIHLLLKGIYAGGGKIMRTNFWNQITKLNVLSFPHKCLENFNHQSV